MRAVIERVFSEGDFEDRPSTYEAAEAIAGRRLDRRKNYAIIHGEVREEGRWSRPCTGCAEVPESSHGPERGIGCEECGYTGRAREAMWLPLMPTHADIRARRSGGGGGEDALAEIHRPVERWPHEPTGGDVHLWQAVRAANHAPRRANRSLSEMQRRVRL